MSTIDFLLARRSTPAICLTDPAPENETLQTILQTAVTAPDHGSLRPWRFLTIKGDARIQLGNVFAEAAQRTNPDINIVVLDSIRQKPLRAPLIIAVIAKIQPNHKIPVREQLFSAATAAYNIILGAQALGYGAIWLTGAQTTDTYVLQKLGLREHEEIVAFIHLGTPGPLTAQAQQKALARPNPADITETWNNTPQTPC